MQIQLFSHLPGTFSLHEHDVSASAGDVSMGSPFFLLAEFCCRVRKIDGLSDCVNVRQNLEPMRKKVISLKHVKLRLDT